MTTVFAAQLNTTTHNPTLSPPPNAAFPAPFRMLFPFNIGQSVKDQIANDLELEIQAVGRLNRAINEAVAQADNGSRDLFESILTDEEEPLLLGPMSVEPQV